MGELTTLIMSMDPIQIGSIGGGVVIGVLVLILLLNKNKKAKTIDANDLTNEPGLDVQNSVGMEETYNGEDPTNKESTTEDPTSVAELLQSALVYDGYGSKQEAKANLEEAIALETHPKEKVRLRVILKNYNSDTIPLAILFTKLPTFLKTQPIVTEQEPTPNYLLPDIKEESHDFPPLVHEQTIDNVSHNQIETEIEAEAVYKKILIETKREDELQVKNDAQDTEDFFSEFGDLAKEIHQEIESTALGLLPKQEKAIPKEKEIHDIWANYMSLSGGKMNLKNTFVHLDNGWGTVAGIAELQEKINHEIGKDNQGNQIPWAIISVLPIKDTNI